MPGRFVSALHQPMPPQTVFKRFLWGSLCVHLALAFLAGRREEPVVWHNPSPLYATLQPMEPGPISERSAMARKVYDPDARVGEGANTLQSAATYANALSLPALTLPGLVDDNTFFRAHEVDKTAAPTQPLAFEFPPDSKAPTSVAVVVVELRIDREGKVAGADVVSVRPKGVEFGDAALDGLRRATFVPARRHGQAVNSVKLLEIVFERDGGNDAPRQIIGGASVDLSSDWVVAKSVVPAGSESAAAARVMPKGSSPIPSAKGK